MKKPGEVHELAGTQVGEGEVVFGAAAPSEEAFEGVHRVPVSLGLFDGVPVQELGDDGDGCVM